MENQNNSPVHVELSDADIKDAVGGNSCPYSSFEECLEYMGLSDREIGIVVELRRRYRPDDLGTFISRSYRDADAVARPAAMCDKLLPLIKRR